MVDFAPGPGGLQNAWQEIHSVNPGALIVCTYPPAGYRLLDLIEKAGSKPEALAMTITPVHPDFASKAGPLAENVFAPSQWEPNKRIPFPGTKRFIRSFQNQFGKQPSYHAAAGYASCQILGKAVKSTESLNQTRIRDFIRSLDTVTVIGRFKVDHTGKQVGHNPLTIQWQDGQKEIVYPPKLRTAAPRFDQSTGLAP
jgi:branched-chain amino acid transport system substrate-binding protein